MKASHRRDVFIARVVFALFCLIVIGIIVGLICVGVSKKKADQETQTETETQKEFVMDFNKDLDSELVLDTQYAEEVYNEPDTTDATTVTLKTTQRVNLRSQPNTDCEVICTLDVGTTVTLLGEEGEWAKVQYNDQVGYIKSEFAAEIEID